MIACSPFGNPSRRSSVNQARVELSPSNWYLHQPRTTLKVLVLCSSPCLNCFNVYPRWTNGTTYRHRTSVVWMDSWASEIWDVYATWTPCFNSSTWHQHSVMGSWWPMTKKRRTSSYVHPIKLRLMITCCISFSRCLHTWNSVIAWITILMSFVSPSRISVVNLSTSWSKLMHRSSWTWSLISWRRPWNQHHSNTSWMECMVVRRAPNWYARSAIMWGTR